MQVIDSSALLAVLYSEPDEALFSDMLASRPALISAVNLHESQISVFRRLGPLHAAGVARLLTEINATVVPFDTDQVAWAFEAHARFGKGRHPARLNLCDCAAYALARSHDLPLLYKGDDFAQTDVVSAVTPD